MKVSSHDNGHGKRVVIQLGGEDHVLGVAKATEVRDALTRELGATQLLTPGEMAVWAAEYVRCRATRFNEGPAAWAQSAAAAVADMRLDSGVTDDARAMLAAMSGGGR